MPKTLVTNNAVHTAVYVAGKELVAYTLSRHAQAAVTQEVAKLLEETESYEDVTQNSWPISTTKLDLIKKQIKPDKDLQMVQTFVQAGWPKSTTKMPDKIKPYYMNRHFLTASDGLVLYNNRLVVPQQAGDYPACSKWTPGNHKMQKKSKM